MSSYFPVHAHASHSVMDGMNPPTELVKRVAELGQPATALTDHGTMAGTVQAYKQAKKSGVLFFPGCEFLDL